jgi:hypothetical protein
MMRKLSVLGIALALCCLVTPVFAWEFHMEGAFYYKWYWAGQIGNEGFFGRHDRPDAASNAVFDATNWNFWAGGNDLWGFRTNAGVGVGPGGNTDVKTGHDAMVQTMWMDIDPEIRINQAVRVRGRYHIGSFGFPLDSENPNSFRTGMQQAFSEGQWYLLWLTAQTPWGIVAVGKRPFAFGLGTIFDGTYETTTESFLLIVPYGPLRIGLSTVFWRPGNQNYLTDLRDKSGARAEYTTFVTYTAGPLDIGIFQQYVAAHAGVEGQALALAGRQGGRTFDESTHVGAYYMKYNNGRFFFNAELDHFLNYRKTQQSMLAAANPPSYNVADTQFAGRVTRPTYVEDWRAAVTLGTTAGPTKISGLWYWAGGLDRRAGAFADTQGNGAIAAFTAATGSISGGAAAGNTVVFLPYSWLLVHEYGGGNNTFGAQSFDGSVRDAIIWAGRVDYAVAANLNTWVSFLWADRVSKSYPWGYIVPLPVATGNVVTYGLTPAGEAAVGLNAVPSIPDTNLGWEVDVGVDWRLLEGFRVEALAAYWQPGRWFSYAARDIGNPAWRAPNAGNTWGVRPDRNIDAVVGGYISLVGEF